nr:CDP-alcohol phosphatidyltransferase family protein [Marinicella sp. W31]MDC2876772.1 CDP-alcohol phosphatidyltransferase family protein [Marinicella sp. W31]
MMLLIAAFLDGVDGRLARLLKASSKFGEQMDSLADIVNFGIAPALVSYIYLLDDAGTPGWIAALLYAIAAALRLARFNVMAERKRKASWQGNISSVFPRLPVRLSCCCLSISAFWACSRAAASRWPARSTPCLSASC